MAGPLIDAINRTIARISEIDKRIAAIATEEAALTAERALLVADLETAKTVLKHIGARPDLETADSQEADAQTGRPARRRPIRDNSSVGLARRILRVARKPLHINVILDEIEQLTGLPQSKATLVSNLSRYVKAGDTFRRTGANTFELMEEAEIKIRDQQIEWPMGDLSH